MKSRKKRSIPILYEEHKQSPVPSNYLAVKELGFGFKGLFLHKKHRFWGWGSVNDSEYKPFKTNELGRTSLAIYCASLK